MHSSVLCFLLFCWFVDVRRIDHSPEVVVVKDASNDAPNVDTKCDPHPVGSPRTQALASHGVEGRLDSLRATPYVTHIYSLTNNVDIVLKIWKECPGLNQHGTTWHFFQIALSSVVQGS